jgi:pentatricopeptide repeat domain-containing protein 1
MCAQGCSTDAILYNTLLDVLWDTGVLWAQQKAAHLLRLAIQEGHFRKMVALGSPKLELPLQGMSPGVAMIMVHCWLADLQ